VISYYIVEHERSGWYNANRLLGQGTQKKRACSMEFVVPILPYAPFTRERKRF